MSKRTQSANEREYQNEEGLTQGAYVGSALDKVLAKDPEWRVVATSAVAETPVEADDDTPSEVELVSPDDYNREELDKLATEAGVEDAGELPNKGAVADAINVARAEAE